MSNICKIGTFSDGQRRIRVVKPGYDADPAPSDVRNIIYDSDWPEVVRTRSGFYGSTSVSFVTDGSGARTSGNYNLTWSTLGYSPIVMLAEKARWASSPAFSLHASSAFISAAANSYRLSQISGGPSGITYSPDGADGAPAPDSETYTVAWWVLLLDTTALGNVSPPSRSGTNFMQLTASGPVVAKPGASAGSTDPDDFLIAPPSVGGVLGQPAVAATVSSLPAFTSFTRTIAGVTTTYYEYASTISHGFGYRPITLITTCVDPRVALDTPEVYIDNTNIYLRTYNTINGSSQAVSPVSYFLFRPEWF